MKLTKKKSIVLSAGAVAAVAYLGACGDDVTQVAKDGFESVATFKDLPECMEDNDGEMLLVKESAAVYLCSDSAWKKMSGVEGAAGKEGTSCTVSALKDSSGYDVLCGGQKKGVLLNGANGTNGINGVDGKSAYEIAKAGGYKGTEAQWLESLKGASGKNGTNGVNGKSAYEIAKAGGYTGSESEWLESLKGASGQSCSAAVADNGIVVSCGGEYVGTLTNGAEGEPCTGKTLENGNIQVTCGTFVGEIRNGKSAYDLAVEKGYTGTLEEWLASLKGANGTDGTSCTVQASSATEGGYTLTCGESSVEIKDGSVGTNCTVQESETLGGYDLTCGGNTVHIKDGKNGTPGQTGATGADGKNCTVAANESSNPQSYTLTCGESSVVIKDGASGANGANGTSCTVGAKNDMAGVYTLTCGESSVDIKDGAAGTSCTVQENEGATPKSYTLNCGGQSVVVSDGANGINGANGVNGVDGSSCTVAEKNNSAGVYVLTCGESSVEIKDGAAGAGCSVLENVGSSPKTYTLTCGTQSVTVSDGANGVNGANGSGCTVQENSGTSPQSYTLTCGSSSIVIKDGVAGVNGVNGLNGADGKSCVVTENSTPGYYTLTCGNSSVEIAAGLAGANGKSAYELAVEKGYTGTLDEWLASLVGANGTNGTNGIDGKSAYELAVEKGYTGTLDEWLASLKGENGTNGANGTNGSNGKDGDNCTRVDNKDGTVTLKCGESDAGVLVYKAVCGSTPFDPDSAICDARDGQLYKTVVIGEGQHAQTWMAQNLNYNKSGSYCGGGVLGTDVEGDCSVYGRLYTWADAKDVCPAGWHLPTLSEFKDLVRNADKGWSADWDDTWNTDNAAGGKLKSTSGWDDNGNGTDELHFTGLPAGYRYYATSKFYNVGTSADFWSSTPYGASNAYRMNLVKGDAIAYLHSNVVGLSFSVRCMKNPKCGSKEFDPSVQFCSAGKLYNLCGGVDYDPATQFCDTRDNQIYKKVTIGEGTHAQTWMAENLNYSKSGSWCGGGTNDATTEGDCSVYGRLYTWADAKDVCPAGWHLPSRGEYKTLFRSVDKGWSADWDDAWNTGSNAVGGKLKANSDLWADNGKGTDNYSFAGLPAGFSNGVTTLFVNVGADAHFWSTTPYDASNAYRMWMGKGNTFATLYPNYAGNGLSVRCLANVCGTKTFDPSSQFCYEEQLYDRCGTVEYDPATQFCDTRDKKVYKTVKIGTQTWMAENLNYNASGSVCHSNNAANCDKYGRLYNWTTAMSGSTCTSEATCNALGKVKGVCPTGWHLPAWSEFDALVKTAGGLSTLTWIEATSTSYYIVGVGAKLKDPTTGVWPTAGNVDKTDANSGFAALTAGNYNGSAFSNLGSITYFWSSTATSSDNAYYVALYDHSPDVFRNNFDKVANWFSVRCLKD